MAATWTFRKSVLRHLSIQTCKDSKMLFNSRLELFTSSDEYQAKTMSDKVFMTATGYQVNMGCHLLATDARLSMLVV